MCQCSVQYILSMEIQGHTFEVIMPCSNDVIYHIIYFKRHVVKMLAASLCKCISLLLIDSVSSISCSLPTVS